MIEVARITYGCVWDERGHVKAWPMRISFGAQGPEVTVDQMLEGRGHAVMLIAQLAELVSSMTPLETLIQLGVDRPTRLAQQLMERGLSVELLQD